MILQKDEIFANRYQLIKQIGQGGYSVVWLAKHTITNVEVVLKIYAPNSGLDENALRIFAEEFALLFNLNHTHLLKPAHFDVEDNMPFLILPYYENGSCESLIGQIGEREAWQLIADVSDGLDYLHSLEPPIVHQDIKPDNILVDAYGRYLITDFGISTRIRSTLRKSVPSQSFSGAGTTSYMGPERFGKTPLPIKASDIWSLGATLFELLTGNVPFDKGGGLIQKSGAEIPEIQEAYSSELKIVIYACLSPEAWNRPKAEQLREYAKAILKGDSPKVEWIKFEDSKKDRLDQLKERFSSTKDYLVLYKKPFFYISVFVCLVGCCWGYVRYTDKDITEIISSWFSKDTLLVKAEETLSEYKMLIDSTTYLIDQATAEKSGVLEQLINAKEKLGQIRDYELLYKEVMPDSYNRSEQIGIQLADKIDLVYEQWENAADVQSTINKPVAIELYRLLLQLREVPSVRVKWDTIKLHLDAQKERKIERKKDSIRLHNVIMNVNKMRYYEMQELWLGKSWRKYEMRKV